MSAVRLKLLRAGYPDKNAVHMFHAAKLMLGDRLLAVGLIYALVQVGHGKRSRPSR
jgi:tight adherence protein C